MTFLPCEQQRIGQGVDGPFYELPEQCQNPDCQEHATERHHIVRRSHLGGPFRYVEIDGVSRPNEAKFCWRCHHDLTENKARLAWDEGEWCWNYHGNGLSPLLDAVLPPPVAGLGLPAVSSSREHSIEQQAQQAGSGTVGTVDAVELEQAPASPGPGEKCPTCDRRINHPRKSDSPVSKPVSFRVPADEADSFEEMFTAAAEHLGISGAKYQKKAVVEMGLVLILQGPAQKLAA